MHDFTDLHKNIHQIRETNNANTRPTVASHSTVSTRGCGRRRWAVAPQPTSGLNSMANAESTHTSASAAGRELDEGTHLSSTGATYSVERLIGTGTFGAVYKCSVVSINPAIYVSPGNSAPGDPVPEGCSLEQGDSVAIKIVSNHPTVSAQARIEVKVLKAFQRRHRRNVAAAGRAPFGGSHVVTLLDDFSLPSGEVCLVMEYLPLTLLGVLQRSGYGGLPLAAVRIVMRQVCAGIHALHVQGLCHSDVKPGGSPRAALGEGLPRTPRALPSLQRTSWSARCRRPGRTAQQVACYHTRCRRGCCRPPPRVLAEARL